VYAYINHSVVLLFKDSIAGALPNSDEAMTAVEFFHKSVIRSELWTLEKLKDRGEGAPKPVRNCE
jgi:hypothetical protein